MIDRADKLSLGPEEIIINVGLVETRIALVSSGKLIELILASPSGESESALLGGIFLGQVSKIAKGVDAAFVTIAPEVTGFLAAGDAQVLVEQKDQADHHQQIPIDACLCEGERVVVQVIKEPLKNKGPRLSAAITLPGRYIVLAPTEPRIAVSRRIEDEDERQRLTELAETLSDRIQGEFGFKPGFIVRTAALDIDEAALAQDAEHLANLWQDLTASASLATPPVRLDAPVNTLDRVLRDFVLPTTKRIMVDDRATFDRLRVSTETAIPDLQDRLVFYDETANAFDLHELEEQIELALSPRVDLPSGVWITIETTEALTAIDVNSGSYAHKSGLEHTARHANLKVVPEIARQIRLREIGGLIVIDFIKMQNASAVEDVGEALRMALAADPAPHQVADMSVFGLIELTRKRVRDPLVDRLTEPTGQAVRQPIRQYAAAGLFRQIEREARLAPGLAIDVQLAPDLARWFDGPGEGAYAKLRDHLGVDVTLHVQDDWPRDRYHVAIPRN